MATKSLKNVLFDALQPRLAPEGFRLKRSDDEFVRRLDGVSHSFGFFFQNERPGCHIEPIAAVRIHRVHEIYHQFVDWGPKRNHLSITAVTSLGHCVCYKGRLCEFFVSSVEDVPAQIENLTRVLHESADPYFQRWQSLQAIDAELNDRSPDSPSIHHPPSRSRFPIGIIVAKLVGRPDFDQLAANYMKKTSLDSFGFYRPSFEALVEYLRTVEPWSGIPEALRSVKTLGSESGGDGSPIGRESSTRVAPHEFAGTVPPAKPGNGGDYNLSPRGLVSNRRPVRQMKYDDASWHYGGDFPGDLPENAAATHTGIFLAWALLSGLGGELNVEDSAEALQKLRSRSVTPGAFFMSECDGKFTDEDLNEEGNAFASEYYTLETGHFIADYEATLGGELPDLYHVADSWENFDQIRPLLDQRFEKWKGAGE